MRSATLALHERRMSRVLAHVSNHLDEALDLNALARRVGISPRQFDRVFLRLHGETLRAYFRRLRIERAARELRSGRRPILALALDAGFGSHESFTRGFTRQFGCSPSMYRARTSIGWQPRNRKMFWTSVLARGLRRHLEMGSVPIC